MKVVIEFWIEWIGFTNSLSSTGSRYAGAKESLDGAWWSYP